MPVRKMDRANTTAQMAMMTMASLAEKLSRLCCRGVLRCWVWFMRAAILAQLGVHAGAGDQHRGPAVGHQGAGEHHVLLVAQGHLVGIDGLGPLDTPSLSPVREDSLTLREKFSSTRPSATTMSPASSRTMSPGTTSAEGNIAQHRPASPWPWGRPWP